MNFQPPAQLPPHDNRPASVLVVPMHDVQWNRPIFRAPSLPSARQMFSEIPFTAQFRVKDFVPTR